MYNQLNAVVKPDNALLKEVCFDLLKHVWFAIPGSGVYYTDETDIYWLELDIRYNQFSADNFRVGLRMYNTHIEYQDHWINGDRVIVIFRLNRSNLPTL